MKTTDDTTTQQLLQAIRDAFYTHEPNLFHRDRKRLIHAITWPASWLEQRALGTSPQTYARIIRQRLDDIRTHGDPQRYKAHFPNYLLKVLQDYFLHHGEQLYDELKHLRNSLYGIDTLLKNLQAAAPDPILQQQQAIQDLARVHHILHTQQKARKHTPSHQLKLW